MVDNKINVNTYEIGYRIDKIQTGLMGKKVRIGPSFVSAARVVAIIIIMIVSITIFIIIIIIITASIITIM